MDGAVRALEEVNLRQGKSVNLESHMILVSQSFLSSIGVPFQNLKSMLSAAS
jgi:hypothetical protein